MLNYLAKILITILFSALIAFFYYNINPEHIENFDGYVYYIIPILISYFIYKYFKTISGNKEIIFKLPELLGYFLLNLFILSLMFFGISGGTDFTTSVGFLLFFKIIGYSIIPIFIIFLSLAFGKKLLKILKIFNDDKEKNIFNFLLSLGLGFFSFIFFLTIIGLIGFYNLYSVSFILLLFIIYSRLEIKELFNGFLKFKIKFENHDFKDNSLIKNIALKLLTTEFLFILASIVLSINLINIVRPMPIGWDDLGVYMNFPRQMAHSGIIDFLSGMYSWQVFTGIGFMISEPTQAFFLNSVGGFLSFIVIILVVSDLLNDFKDKIKTLINIPLLLATIFISMPMVVFQQAKDMKIDEGLFFVSIIVFYLIIKILKKSETKTNFFDKIFNKIKSNKQGSENKENSLNNFLDNNTFLTDKKVILKLLFIIGILAGFAFSLKFTSLLLISAIIGILFYTEIGFFGFLGYLGIYFALFTKANLWTYLNVSYPKDNIELLNNFSFISLFIGIVFLTIGFLKYKKQIVNLFKYIIIFILGIIVAISPWIGKNINQVIKSNTKINLGILLTGKADYLKLDYSKIYSEKKLKSIKLKLEEKNKKNIKDARCAAGNEDLCRYFGYELGINNFVKLPWNLTMQLNQGKEFTDIGWLYLALLPVLLLFLKFRKRGVEYGIILLLFLEVLIFIIPSSREFFTNLMNNITLPGGYLVILFLFLIPAGYLLFGLKNNRLNNLFKVNLVFSIFYIFLFVISAFGIVWYGIVMYFSLLLMIGIALYKISSYKDDELEKNKYIKLFGSFIIFVIFIIYFFLSVFPHGFNNLKGAGFTHFKAGILTYEEAVFAYRPEYKIILSTLNLDKSKEKEIIKSVFNLKNEYENFIYKLVIQNKLDLNGTILFLNKIYGGDFDKEFIGIFSKGNNNLLINNKILSIKKVSKKIRLSLYKIILKPKKEFRNNNSIYRIGTFLKYYITGNNNRILEDGLIDNFGEYIYDKDSNNKTIENMKLLGLKYFLVDLNAATIDNDPRQNLTKRYEKLLKSFTSDKLKLIETDSLCLKIALEDYSIDKNINEYLILAGVNYRSYVGDKIKGRGDKLKYCHNKIKTLISNNIISKNKYNYLLSIYNEYKNLVKEKQIITDANFSKYLEIRVTHGSKVLFEVK